MRILSYVFGTVFSLFAIVQFNDPDFLIWVCLYMIAAIQSFVYTHTKPNKWIIGILGIIYLIGAIELFPPSINQWISAEEEAQSLGMTLPGIEEARESMGLFICFLAMYFFWLKAKRQ